MNTDYSAALMPLLTNLANQTQMAFSKGEFYYAVKLVKVRWSKMPNHSKDLSVVKGCALLMKVFNVFSYLMLILTVQISTKPSLYNKSIIPSIMAHWTRFAILGELCEHVALEHLNKGKQKL